MRNQHYNAKSYRVAQDVHDKLDNLRLQKRFSWNQLFEYLMERDFRLEQLDK